MRSFICKLVYWIMLKLYVFILWALLPLLTMGKGILIQNVVIFDGKSEKTVTGNVWIEDNAIRKVSAEPIVAGAEVEVIDGRGKFLMPGLIDAHWHAYLAANTMVDLLTAHASYTQLRAGEEAGKTLLRGFTTIRDAGGPVFGLKRAIDEGTLPGPRIYPSGAIISETGGHADFRMVYDIPEPFDCCGLTHTEKRQSQPASATLGNIFEETFSGGMKIEFFLGPGIDFLSNLGNFPLRNGADVRSFGDILPD